MKENGKAVLSVEEEELRGIARTVAEIEWLLLGLVLLYLAVDGPAVNDRAAVSSSVFLFAAFVMGFRYANFYKNETRWKLAIEVWVMVLFITWAVWFTGGMDSPLVNLYLLTIITSALALGKMATLLNVGLITACYILLAYESTRLPMLSLQFASVLLAELGPMLLVAYITTMFSADIRYGLNRAKLLSETDELTGLYNMRGLALVLDRAHGQAVRYERPLSILMIDSDNLKAVNDRHGHDSGNELLKQMARAIVAELRSTDVSARYGGDEFVVMLPDTGATGAQDVAERIRSSIATSPLLVRGDSVQISVSVGIACFPEDGRSIDTLMERADRAMYAAKQQGKNRVMRHGATAAV